MREDPLVSCIMPTHDRRAFVPSAIHYFLRQEYANKELIVVDDGDEPIDDLIPQSAAIRYIRLSERSTVGAKRNLACAAARGTIVTHWDDDDWHAANRLRYQVDSLIHRGAELCGLSSLAFCDVRVRRAWLYRYPANHKPWLAGGTFCYRRTLWEEQPFDDVDVGEDARFVWRLNAGRIAPLDDRSFYLATIHGRNVSPKAVEGAWWHPVPIESVQQQLGPDWNAYADRSAARVPAAARRPFRNVYACLVHERPDCILDLVRNLRHNDPHSAVLVYNGSSNPALLAPLPLGELGAYVHPRPRPMRWGWLHEFALDCMRFALEKIDFDALTIVDSDQLSVRPGYSRFVGEHLAAHPKVGVLGNNAGAKPPEARQGPAEQAWRERDLWRPLLRRFPDGEQKFPMWTFWPSTVFTRAASRALVDLFDRDAELAAILRRSTIWASEEVVLPTLAALLGFEVAANPCAGDYVRFRIPCDDREVADAFTRPEIFWIHPVARDFDDGVRASIRRHCGNYEPAERSPTLPEADRAANGVLSVFPILERMRTIDGWFEDDEADLLIGLTARVLHRQSGTPRLLEIGSYCGRSTAVLGSVAHVLRPETEIFAIDPHDGVVGARDSGVQRVAPTHATFTQNMARFGLTSIVQAILARSTDVAWELPLDLLLIDGLHDYDSVAADFHHFADFVVPGGCIVFHDYASYYPGVVAFVDECARDPRYRKIASRRSLCALEKVAAHISGSDQS